jgi:hypothetical protein
MLASNKTPGLYAGDYYGAAQKRWEEVEYLYKASDEGISDFWLMVTYLSVVHIECLLTAVALREYQLAGSPEPGLIVNHDLATLISLTTLSSNTGVYNDMSTVINTWKYWPKDLRYLGDVGWEARIAHFGISDKNGALYSRELIAKETYSATLNIKKEGDKLWLTLTP